MHLPQTLITVMHRTGQQQTETEPKPTKLWNPKWSGVESWWCPCSESARLIQLIFAKPAYRRKGRNGSMRYWKIEYSMSSARERSAPTHPDPHRHTFYWHSWQKDGSFGRAWGLEAESAARLNAHLAVNDFWKMILGPGQCDFIWFGSIIACTATTERDKRTADT